MAKTGNNAAYIQSRALEGDVSADMQYWNNDAGIRRREETAKEKEKFDRAQKAEADKISRIDKYAKPISNYDSGNANITELNGRGIADALSLYPELLNTLETEPRGSEKYIKASTKLTNLGKTAEYMKAITDKAVARHAFIMDSADKGLIKKNGKYKDYLKYYETAVQNSQIGYDEIGMPTLIHKDAEGKVIDAEGYDQIMAGQSAFTFDKNFDADKIAEGISAKVGTFSKTTESNFVKNENSGFDQQSVLEQAKSAIIDKTGELTEAGESWMDDLGLTDNEKSRTELTNWLVGKINQYDKKKDLQTEDGSGRNSAIREARLARESESKAVTLTEPVKPTEATWGGYYKSIANGAKSVGVSGDVEIGAIRGDGGKTISNGKLKNYTIDKYGRMVVQLEVPKTKKLTTKVYSELEQAVADAQRSGDSDALEAAVGNLEMARILKTGDNITLPGENEIVVTAIRKEQEAEIAKELPGGTIQAVRDRSLGSQNEQEEKKTTGTTYKGLDDNGNPIFE